MMEITWSQAFTTGMMGMKVVGVIVLVQLLRGLWWLVNMLFIQPPSDPLRHLPGPDGKKMENHFRSVMEYATIHSPLSRLHLLTTHSTARTEHQRHTKHGSRHTAKHSDSTGSALYVHSVSTDGEQDLTFHDSINSCAVHSSMITASCLWTYAPCPMSSIRQFTRNHGRRVDCSHASWVEVRYFATYSSTTDYC